jgi:nitrogen fixation/metabolism regulation signal transduction histidine kinase
VTNFLNFARPAQLTLADVDLKALVDRVADEVRADVRECGGSLTVSGDFAVIAGDDVLLRQALSNLVRTALGRTFTVRHRHAGGPYRAANAKS